MIHFIIQYNRNLERLIGSDVQYVCQLFQIFEEYLQKLLQTPGLKGSQLLFLFLKTKDEFANTYLPDVSLGRLIRDVPRKLMKERGQHLDAFINVFISSTITQNKNKSKYVYRECLWEWLHFSVVILPIKPCPRGLPTGGRAWQNGLHTIPTRLLYPLQISYSPTNDKSGLPLHAIPHALLYTLSLIISTLASSSHVDTNCHSNYKWFITICCKVYIIVFCGMYIISFSLR